MPKVRASCFSVSIDGFAAGPDQDRDHPLGRHGEELHAWHYPTRTFRESVLGLADGAEGIDDEFAALGSEGIGAWIIGRNMFGPVRGPWSAAEWRGWWGEEPPYRVPVFVLTHHPRPALELKGGTIFHFVTSGAEAALAMAKQAAGRGDVRIGGGVATVRSYLEARLIDELHLAVVPVLLGTGESLFAGLDMRALGYEVASYRQGGGALHVIFSRRA